MAIYRGTECLRCEAKPLCTKNAKHRRISVNEREPYRQKMRAKLKTPDGRETYMRRQAIVEPLHGDDQKNRGWIQHALRGRAKAAGEFLLMRIGTNLRKMCRFQAAAVLAMD